MGVEPGPVGFEIEPVGVEELEYFVPDEDGKEEDVDDAGGDGAAVGAPATQAPVIEGTASTPFEMATRFVESQSTAFARWRF